MHFLLNNRLSWLSLKINAIALFESELNSQLAANVSFLIISNSVAKYCRACLVTNDKNKTPAATAFHLKTRTFIVIAPLRARRCKVVTYSRKIISRQQVSLRSIIVLQAKALYGRVNIELQVHYIGVVQSRKN